MKLAKVQKIARLLGYRKVFSNSRKVLSFQHHHKRGCGGRKKKYGPVRADVDCEKGQVVTSLHHPKSGKTQLSRDVVSYEEIEEILKNPRVHTHRGKTVGRWEGQNLSTLAGHGDVSEFLDESDNKENWDSGYISCLSGRGPSSPEFGSYSPRGRGHKRSRSPSRSRGRNEKRSRRSPDTPRGRSEERSRGWSHFTPRGRSEERSRGWSPFTPRGKREDRSRGWNLFTPEGHREKRLQGWSPFSPKDTTERSSPGWRPLTSTYRIIRTREMTLKERRRISRHGREEEWDRDFREWIRDRERLRLKQKRRASRAAEMEANRKRMRAMR